MSASASSHNDAASAPRQSSDSLDHTHGQSSASDDAAAPSGRSDRRMLSRSGRAGGVELGAAAAPATMKMKRVVSPLFLTASGIGSTIGAGIFVVTGYVAHEKTGPALVLSYLVSGFACLLSAFCYAEFASAVPRSGSAYAFARAVFGEAIGFMMGWDLVLEYAVSAASVARGWSQHLIELFRAFGADIPKTGGGVLSPPWVKDYTTGEFVTSGSGLDLPAVLIVLIATMLVVKGIKESLTVNFVMVVVKVFVVIFVILAGIAYISKDNFSPFMPFGFFGLSFFGHTVAGQTAADGSAAGVFAGAAVVFFSYIGFDSVTTQTEESRNPQRDIPIAIFGSLGITTVLYMLVSFTLVGMVPYKEIDTNAPIAQAFLRVGQNWMSVVIAIGAIAGLTSVLVTQLIAQPRILMAMARDDLLPNNVFGVLHPAFRTPYRASMLTGVVVALGAAFVPLEVLVDLVSIGTLMAFALVCVGVLFLRYATPDYDVEGYGLPPGVTYESYLAGAGLAVTSTKMKKRRLKRRKQTEDVNTGDSNTNESSNSINALGNGDTIELATVRPASASTSTSTSATSAVARRIVSKSGEDEDMYADLHGITSTSAVSSLERGLGAHGPRPIKHDNPFRDDDDDDKEAGDVNGGDDEGVEYVNDDDEGDEVVTGEYQGEEDLADVPLGDSEGIIGQGIPGTRRPPLKRKFRVPCVPFVPILGALFCLVLMLSLPWENWIRLFVWWALGVIVYLAYGRRNAARMREQRQGQAEEEEGGRSSGSTTMEGGQDVASVGVSRGGGGNDRDVGSTSEHMHVNRMRNDVHDNGVANEGRR